ncbi:Hypothetical predicted protein [Cloeon dipterum]|uniref:Angiotensin-converting enzyme n=1 Tax=Cloeon dipterum TaxID=197152 RepID=A0A8S1DES4_9INSE|nr:Hypothetical predicted protein [Cloeon dipterum]
MPRPEHLAVLLLSVLASVAAQLDLPPLYETEERGPRPRVELSSREQENQDVRKPPHFSNVDVPALLQEIDELGTQQCTSNVLAQWNYETNVNEVSQLSALQEQLEYARFQHAVWEVINKIPLEHVKDRKFRRELQHLATVGPAALPPELLDRYHHLINDMLAVYNTATICAHHDPFKCGLRLEPELTLIMARSRDWDELQYVWFEWRRRTGQKIRDLFEQMAHVSNQAAHYNNFTDTGEYWIFPYESPTFRFDVEDAWDAIKPLYVQLHTYVRRKLRDHYGPEKIHRRAPIPAHILGNMWGQSWGNILDVTIPYPGKHFIDVTPEMQAQGYTPITMFKIAEQFYLSLNMTPMPPEFWEKSIFEELPDRHVICQPSAWDFCNGKDFRIKMCAHVNMKDLITAHHEMAHIQFFMHYAHLPKVFRDGANPGFHEAVGEAIGLSISTPEHLQSLGLLTRSVDHLAHDINFLFSQALDKLPFMAFALTMDTWRWDVFGQGAIGKDRYNCHWWRLSEKYTGIKPPLLRSEIDFDPGSKYHVPANIPYIRYFVGSVLQYQIHRALCIKAGRYDPNDPHHKPLHKCDISRSHAAGELLKKMMSMGSSRPWQDALYEITGERKLNPSALLEYFHPLQEWLRKENLRTQEFIGWLYGAFFFIQYYARC